MWAYGSRVSGSAHPSSNLDLVLRNRRNLNQPLPGLPALRTPFSESRLPILVEVLDWARLPDSLRQEIEREHVALRQGAGAE